MYQNQYTKTNGPDPGRAIHQRPTHSKTRNTAYTALWATPVEYSPASACTRIDSTAFQDGWYLRWAWSSWNARALCPGRRARICRKGSAGWRVPTALRVCRSTRIRICEKRITKIGYKCMVLKIDSSLFSLVWKVELTCIYKQLYQYVHRFLTHMLNGVRVSIWCFS